MYDVKLVGQVMSETSLVKTKHQDLLHSSKRTESTMISLRTTPCMRARVVYAEATAWLITNHDFEGANRIANLRCRNNKLFLRNKRKSMQLYAMYAQQSSKIVVHY